MTEIQKDDVAMDLIHNDFHPSVFQNNSVNNVKTNMQHDRTLIGLKEERENKLGFKGTFDISKLSAPGNYNFTSDDKMLSGSNTRHLLKNLYGETPLTFLFFSKDNINNIQNVIRMLVYKQMNYMIDNQSIIDLEIIMRSIFLAYSEHPLLIDEKMPEAQKKALLVLYTKEVTRLNDIVINEIVPKICSQLQQYLSYLKDSSTPIQPIPRSLNVSNAGTRTYRSITSTLLGTTL